MKKGKIKKNPKETMLAGEQLEKQAKTNKQASFSLSNKRLTRLHPVSPPTAHLSTDPGCLDTLAKTPLLSTQTGPIMP